MTLSTFSCRPAATPFSQVIQKTPGMSAGIQVLHIITLSTLFAPGLCLELRMSGRWLDRESLSELAARCIPVIWACPALLLTGSLLVIAEPCRTLNKPTFYIKTALLLAAVMITRRMRARARRGDEQVTALRRAEAVMYMLVWCGAIVAGRLIACR